MHANLKYRRIKRSIIVKLNIKRKEMSKKEKKSKWEYQGKTIEQYTASSAILFYTMILLFGTIAAISIYEWICL